MIIIVEGPDGSGKTHLVKQLVLTTGAHSVHETDPKDFEYEMRKIISAGTTKEIRIFDRSWYSEMVYGKIWRGKAIITLEDMDRLERVLNAYGGGGFIVYCTGDPQVMYERRQKNTNDEHNADYAQYLKVCEEYDNLMLRTPHLIPVFRYLYGSDVQM